MTQKKSFEEAMMRLSEIIESLEKNQNSLDASIILFEEGLELVKQCDTQLKGYEKKVTQLMVKYQDELETEDLP
jgi:exodeoxyribonuclease VII small subunit